jgi:hypothetical protein
MIFGNKSKSNYSKIVEKRSSRTASIEILKFSKARVFRSIRLQGKFRISKGNIAEKGFQMTTKVSSS